MMRVFFDIASKSQVRAFRRTQNALPYSILLKKIYNEVSTTCFYIEKFLGTKIF